MAEYKPSLAIEYHCSVNRWIYENRKQLRRPKFVEHIDLNFGVIRLPLLSQAVDAEGGIIDYITALQWDALKTVVEWMVETDHQVYHFLEYQHNRCQLCLAVEDKYALAELLMKLN